MTDRYSIVTKINIFAVNIHTMLEQVLTPKVEIWYSKTEDWTNQQYAVFARVY